MLDRSIKAVSEFFSLPSGEGSSDIIKAQFEVFSRQVPLMYSVLLINAWILVASFWGIAPLWLTLLCPIAFTAVSLKRLIGWWRDRHITPTLEIARKRLASTNRVAFVMAVFLVSWSLALYPHGDSGQRAHIAFFMSITGVCVVMCLMHLRSAAFIVWSVISIGFFAHFSMSGVPSFVAMAINMPFASVALLMMVHVQANHFTASVAARSRIEIVSQENLKLANTDKLTGLPNRRKFFASLNDALTEAASNEQKVAVAIVDMDGFKSVNDLYGHLAGDNILIEAGRRLAEIAREDMLVSRLGGDEFSVIVKGPFSDDDLLELGRAMCEALNAPFAIAGTSVRLSGSIGFAVYPDVAECSKTLYERADYIHYDCKRNRRGTAALFSKEQIAEIEDAQRIEGVLRGAAHETEILPYYQPVIDITSGQTVAFEALSRWNSPELGWVSPRSFIPIAERIGLIGTLTEIALRKALAAAEQWPANIRLSFNLSTHDIGSAEALDRVIKVVRESAVDPRRIDFEITETAIMVDMARAKTSIAALRRLGCRIALDDFGTGYSSLSQLHSLPLSEIKVDRSFVTQIEKTPASFKIVKSLLALSQDMGLACVIEGVETEAERAIIERLGGTLIQGYYFSMPLTEQAALEFVNTPRTEDHLVA